MKFRPNDLNSVRIIGKIDSKPKLLYFAKKNFGVYQTSIECSNCLAEDKSIPMVFKQNQLKFVEESFNYNKQSIFFCRISSERKNGQMENYLTLEAVKHFSSGRDKTKPASVICSSGWIMKQPKILYKTPSHDFSKILIKSSKTKAGGYNYIGGTIQIEKDKRLKLFNQSAFAGRGSFVVRTIEHEDEEPEKKLGINFTQAYNAEMLSYEDWESLKNFDSDPQTLKNISGLLCLEKEF